MTGRWNALPAAQWDGNLELFGKGSTVPQIYGPSADEP